LFQTCRTVGVVVFQQLFNFHLDGWDDDTLPAPKYISVAIVTKDYIPENNDTLTLILDDLVYVFKKNTGKPGFWEGETKGLFAI
jgi:hypothetical protein